MPRDCAATLPALNKIAMLWVFALSALSLWPFAGYHLAGDAITHYFNMSCFGKAVLDGNFYPRWFSYANDGIGSPTMFFYFPFAYFISSIFTPLTALGLNIEQLYIMQIFVNNVVTLTGCLLWFRCFTTQRAALILAMCYVWFPYRAELLFFRPALAELWLYALVPWVMWMLDRLRTHAHEWPLMAILLAFCILSHIPASIVLCAAMIVLFATKAQPMSSLRPLLLAGFTAALLTGIYWFPALIYKPFVVGNAGIELFNMYPNRQPLEMDLHTPRIRILIAGGASFVFCMLLCITALRSPQIKEYPAFKHMIHAALLMACIALFVLLPISAPLFLALKHMPILSELIMAWRFQGLWQIAAMFAALALLQLPNSRKSWPTDITIIAVLLLLLSVFAMGALIKNPSQQFSDTLKYDAASLKEYQTIWQKEVPNQELLLAQINAGQRESATIVKGQGTITNATIRQDKIQLELHAKTAMTIQLRHLFFPSWEVLTPDTVTIGPDPVHGFMQLSVPKGDHHILLRHNAYNPRMNKILPYLPMGTILLWIGLVFFSIKARPRKL